MKKTYTLFLSMIIYSTHANDMAKSEKTVFFRENKGQISDQNSKPRPDVLFSGTDGEISFHLKKDGISYQLYRVDKWEENNQTFSPKKIRKPEQATSYRVDINWLNSNAESIEKSGELTGYDNYYLPVCPNGVTFVKSYSEVIYKSLYTGINLHYYNKNNQLKYDYIVSPNTDYKQIKIEINGANRISINEKKELVIETPLGKIIEQAPYVTQGKNNLTANWIINKNIVSFEIENINSALSFTIDPLVRTWGTFCGGNGDDVGLFCHSDNFGNVYTTGYSNTTSSGIATIGAHQTIYTGSSTSICGNSDAFLIKFNGNGVRQWGTFYGDVGDDIGYSIASDFGGNIFCVGSAGPSINNTNAFSTIGSYQPIWGGTVDAFIVKFNTNGIRIWGTYYGGAGADEAYGCAVDNSGNIHLTGSTWGDINNLKIVTPGAYQTVYGGGSSDAFYTKFDSNGNRLYGTYFGSTGDDVAYSCSLDGSGNLYLTGATNSSLTTIATSTSHQNTFGGGIRDAFLAKFLTNGMLQWATYYGGNLLEEGFSCVNDGAGNIYLFGYTESSNNIATPGSHKSLISSCDAFLVKFTTNGARQWGTYYGGVGGEIGRCCIVNKVSNDVYIVGQTNSLGIPGDVHTTGCHQDTLGGVDDAFLAKFNSNGIMQWGTYYGGNWEDWGFGVTLDPVGNIFICGFSDSTSPNSISTPGCHQSMPATVAYDVFLVKFFDSGTTAIKLNENLESSFDLFPNPTINFLNLSTEQTNFQNPKLEIINSLGQIVLKTEFKNQIDVSELPSGFYTILLIDNSGSVITKKFVKE